MPTLQVGEEVDECPQAKILRMISACCGTESSFAVG